MKVATSQQVSIRTPGDRIHRMRMQQRLQHGAVLGIPQPDADIIPTARERVAIGGKGHTIGAPCMPAFPGQYSTVHFPYLDAAIPAYTSQGALIRAETKSNGGVCMGLPHPVQHLDSLAPDVYFPLHATRRPVLSTATDGHRPGSIEFLGKDGIAQVCPSQRSILHLDALQIRSSNGKF